MLALKTSPVLSRGQGRYNTEMPMIAEMERSVQTGLGFCQNCVTVNEVQRLGSVSSCPGQNIICLEYFI